jgi:hypothetical protein
MKLGILLLFTFATLFIGGLRAEYRTWTSTTGSAVEAELVDVNSTNVTLKLRDGRKIKIARESLIASDLEILSKKPNAPKSEEVKTVSPIERMNSLPQGLLHRILLDPRHRWHTRTSGREPHVGRYYSEDEKGVTIRKTTGGLVTIPWNEIYRTGYKNGFYNSTDSVKAGFRFRGFVGEEIPWPEGDFQNYPKGNVSRNIKPITSALKQNIRIAEDGTLQFNFVEEIQENGVRKDYYFDITPPSIEPNTWVRFTINVDNLYKNFDPKKDSAMAVAGIRIMFEDGTQRPYGLTHLNPNGEFFEGWNRNSGYYGWFKTESKIASIRVFLPGSLITWPTNEPKVVKVKSIKAYKAYIQE